MKLPVASMILLAVGVLLTGCGGDESKPESKSTDGEYLAAIRDRYSYQLVAGGPWGEPTDEELIVVGYEYCRDFEDSDSTATGSSKGFEVLEEYRGTEAFEMVTFIHDEALDYLCPDTQ